MTLFAPSNWSLYQPGGAEHVGGAERQVHYIARILAGRGYAVRILTINVEPGKLDGESGIELRSMWTTGASVWGKLRGLVREVMAAPSPMYVRSTGSVNVLAALIARVLRRRVVLGMASDLNCVRQAGRFRRNLVTLAGLKASSRVIAQTRRQQALLRDSFGVEAAIWPNVIDRAAYLEAWETPFDDRDIDAIWIGSVEPRKDPAALLEVARRLPDRRFALVGGPLTGGDAYYRSILERAAGCPNVTAPGFVAPSDIPGWLARSRLLLHTSVPVVGELTKEGFPNVFLEAWASGTPVVTLATDPDGMISSEGLGWACRDVSDAAAVIGRVIRSEPEWAAVRPAMRRAVAGRDMAELPVQDELIALLDG